MAKFNLESLRIPQDLEPATRPDFGFIHLRKPAKRAFIRTFLVPARSETYSLVEDFEGELYMALPTLPLNLDRTLTLPAWCRMLREIL